MGKRSTRKAIKRFAKEAAQRKALREARALELLKQDQTTMMERMMNVLFGDVELRRQKCVSVLAGVSFLTSVVGFLVNRLGL